MKQTLVVVTLVAALLAAFFVPVLAMTPEPTHSNGQALEGPPAPAEPGQLLMVAVLPGGRVLKVVHTEGKAGPVLVITVHGPGGEAVVVMPW